MPDAPPTPPWSPPQPSGVSGKPIPTTNPTAGIFLSISRTSVSAGLGYLVGKVGLSVHTLTDLLPYAGVVGTALLGAYSHWKGRQDVKVALALPQLPAQS